MKTIGDFKKAGLEVLVDDIIDGVTGDPSSVEVKISEVFNRGSVTLDAWTIREFAWREGTHEKPAFKGVVEVMFILGNPVHLHIKNITDNEWVLINKWRPLLEQGIPTETPEEKAELDRMFGAASGLPKFGKNPIDRDYFMVTGSEKPCKIMEAVNVLKGDIPNNCVAGFIYTGERKGCDYEPFTVTHLRTANKGHEGVKTNGDEFHVFSEFWQLFTTKEFNELVSQLETNFGKSIVYSEYKEIHNRYIKQLKCRKEDRDKKQTQQKPSLDEFKESVTSVGKISESFSDKLVYTQEMKEKNIQIEAGMLFATECGEYVAEYTNEKSVCFTDEDGFLVTVTKGMAKPITPKVDLIDGECYQFEYDGAIFNGIYRKFDNSFYGYDGDTIAEDCTNIRPLILGGKQ